MPKHRRPRTPLRQALSERLARTGRAAIQPRFALRVGAVALVAALPLTVEAVPAAESHASAQANVAAVARPAIASTAPVLPADDSASPALVPAKRELHRAALAAAKPPRVLRPKRPSPQRPATATVASAPTQAAPSHYIRSLTGTGADATRLAALGAADAARNGAPGRYLVLLDIGGQLDSGVLLSQTSTFVSYQDLVAAIRAYVDGYHAQQRARTSVLIAIGTNNDVQVNVASGIAWATQVVNPLHAVAARYRNVTIAGADDIEPGFSASPAATRAWLTGYLAATSAPFVFNGSADACYTLKIPTQCAQKWTVGDVAQLAGMMAPARTLVLPQIYNDTMAQQWAWLSQLAARSSAPLHIVGTLTENDACGKDPKCPTMPAPAAWSVLTAAMRGAGLSTSQLVYRVDLDVS